MAAYLHARSSVELSQDRKAALLCACLILAGCYSTSSPIFDRGERVPIAGQSTCRVMMADGPKTETHTEHSSGWWSRDYRYTTSDGRETIFRRIEGSLYVGQFAESLDNFVYFYFDFASRGKFFILAPSLERMPYVQQAAQRLGVTGSGGMEVPVRLSGPKNKIGEFLTGHRRDLLMVVGECSLS